MMIATQNGSYFPFGNSLIKSFGDLHGLQHQHIKFWLGQANDQFTAALLANPLDVRICTYLLNFNWVVF
jgi:hypothetical protein